MAIVLALLSLSHARVSGAVERLSASYTASSSARWSQCTARTWYLGWVVFIDGYLLVFHLNGITHRAAHEFDRQIWVKKDPC